MANLKVESEITGKVWKVVAREGTVLEEEGVILIIESMKMEIAVAAPCAGTVVEILVSESDDVLEGQVVAHLSEGS